MQHTLVRVPQSIYQIAGLLPDDAIACLDCGVAGSHLGVVKEDDGLVSGILTTKQRAEITERLRTNSPP
jgi:hypothetical protein